MRTTGVSRYHLNSFFNHEGHQGKKNALCNWRSPVYAVTGNPVTVYSARTFLRQWFQATSALFACGCFHQMHPSLSGHRVSTPSWFAKQITCGASVRPIGCSTATLTTPEWLGLYISIISSSRINYFWLLAHSKLLILSKYKTRINSALTNDCYTQCNLVISIYSSS